MAVANLQTVWNYLINSGASEACAAGIMGNIQAESSFDIAAYNPNDNGSPSAGLCQWHLDRMDKMMEFCANHGGSWSTNLTGQLGYLMQELTGSYSYVWSKIKNQSSTDDGVFNATAYFVMQFEVAGGSGWQDGVPNRNNAVQVARYKNAISIYNEFTKSSSSASQAVSQTTYMTAGQAILEVAKGEVGTRESGTNNIKYNTWYYGHEVSGSAYAWCAIFLKWCANQAGVDIPGWDPGISRSNAPNSWNGNAIQNGTFIYNASELQSGDIIFFSVGHVGIVESVSGGIIYTIEGNSSDMVQRCSYGVSYSGILGGQRLNGKTSFAVNQSGSAPNATAASGITYSVEYQEVTAEVKTSTIYTADADANAQRTRANNLLTTPTLVESPFIILKVGDYTFGSYSINGSFDKSNSSFSVNYPNYMTSIQIIKVNGQVNRYTITMVYQIRNGDDPNLLDKIFSSVGYGEVLISYGDWCTPKFIYQDERAVITKLTTNVDFANSRITYILNCTSSALALLGGYYNFPADNITPSQRIYQMMYDEESKYGLQKIFNGFKNNKAFFWECIAADDVSVETVTKNGMDALSYINYLVTCMSPTTTPKNSAIRDANYYLTIREDKEIGTYFTIKKVSSSDSIISLNNSDVYEVDVGYPGDTLVTNFKIKNDASWALLYNYAENVDTNEYVYNIDSEGQIYGVKSPSITTSSKYLKTTETQRSWWTQMTQFPITATLTIKGLLRPAMLMTYVRINAMFYGLRHVSSGLYVITRQVDTIDSNGYRTELTLTRVAGDLDAIITDTKLVTTLVPVYKVNS